MLNPLITFFGFIINYIYQVINNYGATILVFTLFTKIVLFPVNILIQKNSIKMVKIKPRLEELKLKYADDREKFISITVSGSPTFHRRRWPEVSHSLDFKCPAVRPNNRFRCYSSCGLEVGVDFYIYLFGRL